MSEQIFAAEPCPRCGGRGACRNGRHLAYGATLLLLGSGAFLFATRGMDWHGLLGSGALPQWLVTAMLWILTAVPAVFGAALLYVWIHKDTCPLCRGHRRVEKREVNGAGS